jgi:hypothetical protein
MVLVDINPQLIIAGYQQLVEQKIEEGWKGYLLTVVFKQLSGSRSAMIAQTADEVERLYRTMLTRIVRNPKSPDRIGKLPIWLGSPDLPVFKTNKSSLAEVTINDGLHYHLIALIPPRSRLADDLVDHVRDQQALYAKAGRRVMRLDAVGIETRPAYVTDYALKSLSRRRFGSDEMLIFPRSRHELPD